MSQTNQITLYVIMEHNESGAILDTIVSRWEDMYGGVTVFPASGHWGGVTEDVMAVQTVCMGQELDREDLKEVQEYIIERMGESAVLATIDTVEPVMVTESQVNTKEKVMAD